MPGRSGRRGRAHARARRPSIRSSDKTVRAGRLGGRSRSPGAADVTGYRSRRSHTASATASRPARHAAPTRPPRRRRSVGWRDRDYSIEVRSLTGARMGEAFVVEAPRPPVVAAPRRSRRSPATRRRRRRCPWPRVVTLSIRANANIYYTTDGSPVITGRPADGHGEALHRPIAITAQTSIQPLRWTARATSARLEGTYVPPTQVTAAVAPTGLTVDGGPGVRGAEVERDADTPSPATACRPTTPRADRRRGA